MGFSIVSFQLLIVSKGVILRTVILHDHILIIAVSCLFVDGINTSFQIIDVILFGMIMEISGFSSQRNFVR